MVSDNDFQESEDGSETQFESIREAGASPRSKKRKLGPPITIDEKLERLNETHRIVIEEFLLYAKRESDNVCLLIELEFMVCVFAYLTQILLAKNLRSHPFTDTILREMVINFPKGDRVLLHR